jgi:adenylate cyclase class 2
MALIDTIGIRRKAEQLMRREIWHLGEVEVVIDEWPWIDPFIEIEAPTEQLVKDAAAQLGFDWKDAAFGDVVTAYRDEYPRTEPSDVYELARINFDDPVPGILRI